MLEMYTPIFILTTPNIFDKFNPKNTTVLPSELYPQPTGFGPRDKNILRKKTRLEVERVNNRLNLSYGLKKGHAWGWSRRHSS